MSVESLEDKILYARSLSESIPELGTDIVRLLKKGIGNTDPFLIYRDKEGNKTQLNYREFYDSVLDTARFFQSKDLQTGDKIATISHNHWHTVVQYFAAWFCGLVVVPVNLSEDDQRIEYILKNAGVKMALVREEYVSRIKEIVESSPELSGMQLVECGKNTDSFSSKTGDLKEPEFDSETDALIVFTSGTTGNPKGVVLSQRNLLEDARAISDWHNIDKETRMMCVLPIHHVNGTVVTLMTPFLVGGSVVLNEKFQIDQFFHVIEEEDVKIVSVVPTLLQYLTSFYEDKESPELKNFSHIICGAGPLTVNVAKNFEAKFGKRIIHGYGLSETTCYSCYLPLDISKEEHQKWMQDFGYPSIGVAIPANEMSIHDEQGNALEEGERGEIVIRGVNVMKGYFNNAEANEKAFTNGWFRSGDEGFYQYDEEGNAYYFITGRIKELIIRGGINFAPLEIDEVINKALGVKAGIAVGFENDWYGEEVGAYIELEEGAEENEEAILAYCKKHLPHAKTPKVIVFGNEIPVTSTGKYQRRKVAHLFSEWKEVQFRKGV
ncbi:MAG: acyl--CoA ligase [Balneola sp.]|nr:acyl--CoA ligase [Balneola sp.]MBO6650863.1 acyl--CoA ligase [Balneola sp.]MBO6710028.1 acyl--CoA ligase [Balneola sp.]MBO6798712.1 acyl--CoA ligase [Balneola sp.]MBO6869826.1 acyl--CoA ligase [Balneola sp.]